MPSKLKSIPDEKDELHPRNKHRGRYDFAELIKSCPELANFVNLNQFQDQSVDFTDPLAVKTLNRALLIHYYGISLWDIPDGFLCPPIPGRADYLHYAADLLADTEGLVPTGKNVKVLDIGVGANCVYPRLVIVNMVGTLSDRKSIISPFVLPKISLMPTDYQSL